jgi:hypothetical protein
VALSSTKRALIAVAVILCFAAVVCGVYLHRLRQPLATPNRGPAPNILSQLPPDAPAMAYIDVQALRKLQNSPLSALLGLSGAGPQRAPQAQEKALRTRAEAAHPARKEAALSARNETAPEYAQFVADTGFDYTRDLDRVAIAFWPTDLAPAANAAGDNPALAIADGRFDQRKITAYALRVGGKTDTVADRTRYVVPGYPPVAFQFLSPTRIVIASGKNAADLINLPAASLPDPSMQARINRVAGAPFFGVARTDHLPNSFYANFESSPQLDRLVRSIRGLSLAGQGQGDQLRLAVDAECDSMTNAIEISTILDGFRLVGSMALADPKTRAQLQMTPEQFAFLEAFVKQAQVTRQDHWVRISLDVTTAMLGEPSRHARRAPASSR